MILDLGELDMTDSINLEEFIIYSNKNFPAKKTVLVISSHGNGVFNDELFFDDNVGKSRSIIQDYSTNYSSEMQLQDFSKALQNAEKSTNKKIDIIYFDACLMQMIEICWQLKDLTNYIVASQSEVPGTGGYYEEILKYLKNNSNQQTLDISLMIAEEFYNKYKNCILSSSVSVISSKSLNEEVEVFKDWIKSLLSLDENQLKEIIKIRINEFSYNLIYKEFIDLYSFCLNIIKSSIANENLRKSTFYLIESLDKIIKINKTTNEYNNNLYGLSFNFPIKDNELKFYLTEDLKYDIFDIYKESELENFIIKINDTIEQLKLHFLRKLQLLHNYFIYMYAYTY